jgi:hypothetical protein
MLDQLIDNGDLRATEEVLRELERKDDQVYGWAKARPRLFIPLDMQIQQMVSQIQERYPQLVDLTRGRSIADPWVIALAMLNSACVVTGEHASNKISKPKIPDVCEDLRIPYRNLLGFIREQQWVF